MTKPTDDLTLWLTPAAVAARSDGQHTRADVLAAITSGDLPAVDIGGALRVKATTAQAWLTGQPEPEPATTVTVEAYDRRRSS